MPLIKNPNAAPVQTEQANSDLLADLKSPESEVRWSAARALGQNPSSLGHLAEALGNEPDARIREALLTSLARNPSPEAVEIILPYLRSNEASLRTGALDALNAMPLAVEKYLPNLFVDPDPDIRLLVCEVARRLPNPSANKLLCELLERETLPNVAAAAVEALSEVGEQDALPVLAKTANRFANEPFLIFSIKVASERIGGDERLRDPQEL